jgi:hypothetical protein
MEKGEDYEMSYQTVCDKCGAIIPVFKEGNWLVGKSEHKNSIKADIYQYGLSRIKEGFRGEFCSINCLVEAFGKWAEKRK